MHDITLGEVLERYRKKLNVKKVDLCRGLCTLTSYTRYERDERIPDKYVIDAILERLDYETNLIEFISTEEEFQFRQLRDFVEEVYLSQSEEAEIALNLYEKIASKENLHMQYIDTYRGKIEKLHGKSEESEYFFRKAFSVTQSNTLFSEGIKTNLLTNIECDLYLELAELIENKDREIAFFMYSELFHYFQKRNRTRKQTEFFIKVILKMAEFELERQNLGNAGIYLLESEKIALENYQLEYLEKIYELKQKQAQKGILKIDDLELENTMSALHILNLLLEDGSFDMEGKKHGRT